MENLALLTGFNWSKTVLGPYSTWTNEMRTVAATALHSTFPICLVWGDDLIQIYNDGYNRIYGDKHPAAFGAPAAESWSEIWQFLKPALDRVRTEKAPRQFANYLLPLRKSKMPEECYFTFCYSPIVAADGSVPGVMSIAMETTTESVAARRQPLTGLLVDASSSMPHPISARLKDLLADNELDGKAAFIHYPDELAQPIEWTIRCDEEAAENLLSLLDGHTRQNPFGLVSLRDDFMRPAHADFVGFVNFKPANGRGIKTLVLWPSDLVTRESTLDLLQKLSRRLQAITRQFTNLNAIKKELAQSDLLYRFLFENTVDGVVYCSANNDGTGPETIITANHAACDILGYRSDEVVGMRREDFFFVDDEDLQGAISERSKQEIFSGELTFRHKSGRPLRLEITSTLPRLNSGQRRSISILRDLSAKVHAERERAERSRLETIARMTAGISHDFNNLLMVILSAAEHLDVSLTDGSQREVVGDILTASNRAADLTSQLLAYSRQQDLHPRRIDINSTVREIERLLQGVVAKEVSIRHRYSRRPLVANVDAALLTSALVNLVKNASEAIAGAGTIFVKTGLRTIKASANTSQMKPGSYVTIAVEDNGIGIAPKVMERIFDPFYTTKPHQGGSGLGLSMVQGFARQSGGDILFASEPRKGTIATLYLPSLQRVSAHADTRCAPLQILPVTTGHVLVIDDDPLIRRQVGRILTTVGMTFTEAGNGAEAIELLDRDIRMVISDVVMPKGPSGIGVLEACRRRDPPIPVILMSGFATKTAFETTSEHSVEVLRKPFSREALVRAIESQLT